MKRSLFAAGAGLCAAITLTALAPTDALAGLCTRDPVKPRHRRQARTLETRAYSNGNNCQPGSGSCWVGRRSYNATVIGCNRRRDTNGKKIRKGAANGRTFAPTLRGRFITGKYRFLGAFKKRYGYKLSRTRGVWHITSMLDFKFPKAERKKLHIPMDLAASLSSQQGGPNLTQPGQMCSRNARGRKGNGIVRVVKKNGASRTACRVPRNARFFGLRNTTRDSSFSTGTIMTVGAGAQLGVRSWLMLFWRDVLERAYTNMTRSVRLSILIANFAGHSRDLPGKPTRAQVRRWKRAGAIYPVEFHHRERRFNNMYRPIRVAGFKVYKAIYAGLSDGGIVHEYSHSLGLGDDYPPRSNNPKPRKDCDTLTGTPSRRSHLNYVMCNSDHRDLAIKSVYLWIITQRYTVGDPA